jgi:predicted nuclease of predicted toxin-antitoxin system
MKFLVDAQLPLLLATWIREKGFDVIHTDDLPLKDETGDNEIRMIADRQERIVITKDADFYDSYILRQSPNRLLLISTGNIKNRQLLDLFRKNFQQIVGIFGYCNFVEMDNIELIAHE